MSWEKSFSLKQLVTQYLASTSVGVLVAMIIGEFVWPGEVSAAVIVGAVIAGLVIRVVGDHQRRRRTDD